MARKLSVAGLLWVWPIGLLYGAELPVHQIDPGCRSWCVSTSSPSTDSLHLWVSDGKLQSSVGQISLPVKGCRVGGVVSFPCGIGVLALFNCSVGGEGSNYVAYIKDSKAISILKVCDGIVTSASPYPGGLELQENISASDIVVHRILLKGEALHREAVTKAPKGCHLVGTPYGFCASTNWSSGERNRVRLNLLRDSTLVADIDLGKLVDASGSIIWSKSINNNLFVGVISGNLVYRVYYIAPNKPKSAIKLYEGEFSSFDALISSENTILLAAYGVGGVVVTEHRGPAYAQRKQIVRLGKPKQKRALEFLEFVSVRLGRKDGRETLFTKIMPHRY